MPLPKRRHSHARGAKRRTHYTLSAVTVVASKCPGDNPDCPGARVSHTACPVCGWYNGRQAVPVKQKKIQE